MTGVHLQRDSTYKCVRGETGPPLITRIGVEVALGWCRRRFGRQAGDPAKDKEAPRTGIEDHLVSSSSAGATVLLSIGADACPLTGLNRVLPEIGKGSATDG